MIFGRIKGLGADRSIQHTLCFSCLLAALFCLFGFMSGYIEVDENFAKRLKPFEWDAARVLFFIGELVAFGAGSYFASFYKDPQSRYGAMFITAVPLLAVLILAASTVAGIGL